MRTLEPAIDAAKSDRAITSATIVKITGDSTYLWTDFPVSLTYNSEVYNPNPFTTSQTVFDDRGNIGLEVMFSDQDDVIKTVLYSTSMRNWPIEVSELWLDGDNNILGRAIKVSGRVDGVEINEEGQNSIARIVVTASLVPLDEMASQIYSISCRHVYKDEFCQYSGTLATCARTWADCKAHANEQNYGGYPFAPTGRTVIKFGERQTTVTTRKE